MTDKTQPEALRLAEQYDYGDPVAHSNAWKAAVCTEPCSQHARIAELKARVQELGAMARENRSRRIVELEAQLEAIGAGGVQALSAAPAGWKLVPVEPTVDQEWAGKNAALRFSTMGEACKIYKAMLAASPTTPAGQPPRWVERWHGSGGKEFWEGWSILNATNREMIAHLGPDVDPDAVRDIVAAHNEALCGECAGTGGRWCPACAGATPPAEQAAPKAAPGVDKCTKLQMTTEVLRRMQQQEDGHNKNPFRSLLDRLMRNEGGYSTIEIGQLKYALDGFYGAARAPAAPQPAPAPLSDDTERLNWLLWKLPGDALRYVVGELADTSNGAEFRAAIDTAIAAQGGKV